MSQKFQSAVQQRGDVGYVKLSGVIDEDNELADLSGQIPGGVVVIELGEVERINSCGVRDWVNWLSALEAKGGEVVLVKCSPAIVAQINLVNNFTGNGSVKSFYVPYFCPECDEEKVLLSETAEMGPPPHEPPVCRCDGCDLVMDFDDMPDSYFAFLSSQKKVAKAAKFQSVLDDFPSDDGKSAKIRSRVGASSVSGNVSNTSLPSVPSLPSITGTGTGGVGSRPGALPSHDYHEGGTSSANVAAVPAEGEAGGGMMVYMLVAVLLAAIGILGFLVFSS
jgi:anti-anti-sigma regulatory factor